MEIGLSQQAQQRLGQQLRLAPRVLQSMEILQMPLESLEERVDAELESNVALEVVEQLGADTTQSPGRGERLSTQGAAPSPGDPYTRAELIRDRAEDDAADLWRERARVEGESDARMAALASLPSRGESLEEVLLGQWALCEAPRPIMDAGRHILHFIGENGLLTRTLEAIAVEGAGAEDPPSVALLEEALKRLQQHLEPTGLAARNLRECLLLQLEGRGRGQPPSIIARLSDARELIEHHLHDLETGKFAAIERKRNWTKERLDDARAVLRHLDPSPGRSLVVETAAPIRPDVIIDFDQVLDQYSARLASGLLPNLRVSEEYLTLSKAGRLDGATRELLTTGIRRAKWFIDAIEQRGATLIRVVNEVILRQREWLDAGAASLKPLPMTHVARELKMNVSTVSRAVAGKWIETPRGSFELRKLFSGGTETDSGADISWEAVKAIVAEIVAAELPSAPLSDQAIALALKERGVTLARRTVVKYREQLGIPESRLRKARQTN